MLFRFAIWSEAGPDFDLNGSICSFLKGWELVVLSLNIVKQLNDERQIRSPVVDVDLCILLNVWSVVDF